MIKNIKQLLRKKEFKVLISNFLSLSVLQALNILLPFLTIPFIIKKAGLDSFGLLSYASTLVLFFIVFVEYGFNTITTRDISIHSENKEKVKEIYSEVITTKIFLLLIATIVFSVIILGLESHRKDWEIYFLSFLNIIGFTLFPVWLFQGLQKMKYITYINVFFKSIFTICIFIFLKDKQNLWIVPLFTALGFITSGIASVIFIRKKFKIKFRLASVASVKNQLKSSYHIFTSEMYISLIAYANIIILRYFAGDTIVGIYALAEKVIRAIGSFISPIINSLYPHISKTINENFQKGILFVRQVEKWGKWAVLFTSVFLFLTADYLFSILYGSREDVTSIKDSVLVFRIMSLFPLFSFLDQVYGKLVLIANRKEKLFFRVFSVCSIINVVLCTILSYKFSFIGTAISSITTQLLVMLGMYYYAKPILKSNSDI